MFRSLNSALHFSAAEAPRANINMLGGTVNNSLNALYVGLPGTVGPPVRVGNLNTERDVLVAKFALCHLSTSLIRLNIKPRIGISVHIAYIL